jgi:acyl-CoA synthetase (AMP-forming)/AMP-acid ligase II
MPAPTDARRIAAALRDLTEILRSPGDWTPHAKLVARKLPRIVAGLRLVARNDRDEALSIGSMIADAARRHGDRAALLYEDRRWTYRQFHEQSNAWASWLAGRGLRKGDVAAVLVENRPELLLAVAGLAKLGVVAAVINTRQRGRVLQHSLAVAKARFFLVGEELWEAFGEVREAIGAPAAAQVGWVRDRAEAVAPADAVDASAGAAAGSTATPASLADVRLGDPCFYIYTSGTTGLPKASIMTHNRWTKAAGAFGLSALGLTADDVLYLALPLYHNNALTIAWGSAVASGAALAVRRRFSVSQFWDDVRRYRATAFVYIGELCRYLLNQPARPDDRAHPVRRIAGNGLRPDIWRAFKQRFGIDEVYEFYAASEGNAAFVNLLNLDCTVGLCPAPFALVAYDVDADAPVRGPDGRLVRVGRGEVGLLITEVSERYTYDGYTDPAASERKLLRDVFRAGDTWFNTGDLMRDQGFRHAQFVDRVGDTFRWKGENVSTNEVAEAVNAFPQVAESTVYGVQVPGSDGRCGMAALVLRCPVEEFDLAGFARHVERALPAYARPVFLRVRQELEVTGTFKQVKSELRRDGYDPARCGEPVYAWPARQPGYVAVDAAVQRALDAGQLAL